jgi:hypothetical protein
VSPECRVEFGWGDAAMLFCERCGCSGEPGMGWLSVVRADIVQTQGTGWMLEYCPACAAAVFGSTASGRCPSNEQLAMRARPSDDRPTVRGTTLKEGT